MSDLVSLKCPSCGGQLTLDRSSIGAECKYCGSQFLIKEAMTAQGLNNVADAVIRQTAAMDRQTAAMDRQEVAKQRKSNTKYNNLLARIQRGIELEDDWKSIIRWTNQLYVLDSSDEVYILKCKIETLKDMRDSMTIYDTKYIPMIEEKSKEVMGFAIGFGFLCLSSIVGLVYLLMAIFSGLAIASWLVFTLFLSFLSFLAIVISNSISAEIKDLEKCKPNMLAFEDLRSEIITIIDTLVK